MAELGRSICDRIRPAQNPTGSSRQHAAIIVKLQFSMHQWPMSTEHPSRTTLLTTFYAQEASDYAFLKS